MTTSQQPRQGDHDAITEQIPTVPPQGRPTASGRDHAPPPAVPALNREWYQRPLNWVGIAVIGLLVVGIIGNNTGTSAPPAPVAAPAATTSAPSPGTPGYDQWLRDKQQGILDGIDQRLRDRQAAVQSSSAPAVPTGPVTTVSDGTYEVGVDMVPGRYKTTGPAATSYVDSCYLERSKDDSGQLSSIIANDNINGPGSVTVKAGEFAKFSGSCIWTKQ